MAFSTFIAATTGGSAASAAAPTVSLALPAGAASGDYQLVVVGLSSSSMALGTTPAGWAELTAAGGVVVTSSSSPDHGGTQRIALYESTTATATFTLTTTGTGVWSGVRIAHELPAGSTGRTVALGQTLEASGASATTHATPSVTTTAPDSVIIGVGVQDLPTATAWTDTGAWTQRALQTNGPGNPTQSIIVGEGQRATAGAATATFTSAAADSVGMFAVVIDGASSGPTSGVAVAALGGLTATATGVRNRPGTAVASLGALTATTSTPVRSLTSAWLGVDAVTVVTSTTAPTDTARVAFSTSSAMTSPVYSTGLVAPDAQGASRHTLPTLTADTAYWYRVELGGVLIGAAQAFQSLPSASAAASFKFGFASCRSHTAAEPSTNPTALADAVSRGADLFLEIGDFHYRDITANTPSLFRAGYDELHTRSNIDALLKAVPTAYVWDDHDTGGDNTDGTDVALPAAQSVYRERVPHTTLPSASGIYHTFRLGRVRFVMLDSRSFRSPVANTDNSSKTMLGSAQKTWLQGLLDNADTPVTVICSPVGWIGTSADTGQDHWGFYATERTEIGGFITAADTQVIFLCGDAHMLAIDNGTNAVAGTPVYHAAALNQFTSTKGGPYSGGSRASQNAYGFVDVVDTGGSTIGFTYSGYYDGSTLWSSHTTTVAVPVQGTAVASLGALTATAAGVRGRPGTAVATLGGLTATAAGTRATTGSAAAALAALTATAGGVRATTGTAAAVLGGLTATAVAGSVSYLGATGGALNPSVWLVDRTTGALSPLPVWASLDLSPVVNSPGSCGLVVAAGQYGFDTLHENVSATPQRDQEIETWLAGSPATRMRWLLQQKSGDDLNPGDPWTFTGGGLELLLAEALVGPQATDTQELVFGAVTYGTILITALQQAQLRAGVLVGVTWDFTTTHDSAGVAWASTITDLAFAPDATLLDVADVGPEEGIGEFAMGPDRVLSAWNFGDRGTDRSTGATPLRLAHGANLTEAARRESSRAGDAATATLGKGAEGQYQWATDATAQAERGRRVEVAVDAGKIASAGGVLAAAQGRLATLKTGVRERTHGVAFGPGLPIPGVDYDVADWALSVTGNAASAQRITQWTLSFQAGGRGRGTVRTNDLIADRLVKLIKRLDRVQRGGSVVGTSTASPDLDDGKLPAAPTGLVASSSAYFGSDGETWGAVVAAWTAVTTNADATAADDIVGYLPQYRYTGAGMPTAWQPLPQVADNGTDFDGVIPGQDIEVRVAAIDRFDHIGAWSTAYALTSGADATAPPVPSTPTVTDFNGALIIAWDGLGSAGEVMPPDFSHVQVHRSTSAAFTPTAGTRFDEIRATPGVTAYDGGTYGTTYYIKLVAEDRSGNPSDPSAAGSATPQRLVGDDLTDGLIAAAKLADGAVTGPKIQAEAVSTPHLSVATFSDSLIPNGGFEDLPIAGTYPVGSWYPDVTTGGTLTRETVAADVSSGSASLKFALTAASGKLSTGSEAVPTEPGDTWFLEANVKASRAVGGGFSLFVSYHATAAGAALGFVFPISGSALTTAFVNKEVNVAVPATVGGVAPKFMKVYLIAGEVSSDAAALNVWVDHLRARKVVGTAEIQDAAISTAKIALLAVQDANVGTMNVGKLVTGTLSATVTVSGSFQTGPAGVNRWVGDGAGIRFIRADNTVTIDLNTASGNADIVGRFRTSSAGNRIDINPPSESYPTMYFYDSTAGSARAYINAVPVTGGLGLGMNSGPSSTGANQTTLFLLPEYIFLQYNTFTGTSNQRRGGYFYADATSAHIGVTNSAAQNRARIAISGDAIAMESVDNAGDRDGGFLWLGSGSTGDVYLGRQTSTIDSYIRFPNSEVEIIRDGAYRIQTGTDGVAIYGGAFIARAAGLSGGRLPIAAPGGADVAFVWNPDLGIYNHSTGAFIKTFVIDHPDDPARHLVHATTESPHPGVEYWGIATVEDGEVEVELPPYFESLTHSDGRVVLVTVLAEPDPQDRKRLSRRTPRRKVRQLEEERLPSSRVDGGPDVMIAAPQEPPPGLPSTVQATIPHAGRFTIFGLGPVDTFRVMWLVKAIRKDVKQFDVEPLKSAGTVRGDGPYTYLVGK